MFKKFCLVSLVLSSINIINAKDKSGVIMTVDGEEVPTEEFLYLYQKNNQQQSEPQSLDEYLKLFEVYRLKVAEAKSEGVDTTAAFHKEMNQYRRELLEPYITDTLFFNQLVDIAAEREKTEVESSHIMIIRTHDPEKDARNLALLDSIRTQILNGADFIELAKKYSQDKFSSGKGGYLGFTPAGTFPYGFETAEYETPEGEISDIIESHVGWHIIKAGARKPAEEFDHKVRSYEEIKADVLRKSSSPFDTRYHQIRRHNMDRLLKKHKDLGKALADLPEEEAYEIVLATEEADQYSNNSDYRNLVDEYVNGSLLYEVSVKNVWDKAANDEDGLQQYYNNHKADYNWDSPRAKGILVQALNDSVADKIKTEIQEMPTDSVVKYIRNNYKKEATADRFNMPKGSNALIDVYVFGDDSKVPEKSKFNTCFVVEGRIVEIPEELNDVRGRVIADYQEVLENEWVDALRAKHNLVINDKELARIRKTIK